MLIYDAQILVILNYLIIFDNIHCSSYLKRVERFFRRVVFYITFEKKIKSVFKKQSIHLQNMSKMLGSGVVLPGSKRMSIGFF